MITAQRAFSRQLRVFETANEMTGEAIDIGRRRLTRRGVAPRPAPRGAQSATQQSARETFARRPDLPSPPRMRRVRPPARARARRRRACASRRRAQQVPTARPSSRSIRTSPCRTRPSGAADRDRPDASIRLEARAARGHNVSGSNAASGLSGRVHRAQLVAASSGEAASRRCAGARRASAARPRAASATTSTLVSSLDTERVEVLAVRRRRRLVLEAEQGVVPRRGVRGVQVDGECSGA